MLDFILSTNTSYNKFATLEISHQVVAGQTISFKYNISGPCGYTDPNGKELNKIDEPPSNLPTE